MTSKGKGITLAEMLTAYPKLRRLTDPMEILDGLRVETGWSLAQIVSELVEEEREMILAATDTDKLINDWNFWGRPSQIPPKDVPWTLFAFIGGRGVGKTRAGAEWVHSVAMANPGCRIGLVARTAKDTRDVMVEGDSGLLNIGQPEDRPTYYSSKSRVVWPNGSQATTYSSEEPDQLRGPQFNYAWADEAAAWKHTVDDSGLNAWDNLMIATRLGKNPQVFATTTPKRTKFMFELIEQEKEDETIILTRGSTMDNAGNLSKGYIQKMKSLYEGTRLMDQELYGLMLEEIEGALWNDELLAKSRLDEVKSGTKYPLTVIAVDPSVAEEPNDECGIIVAGATKQRRLADRHAYIIEDASLMASPLEWAQVVVDLWKVYQCPVIVETNQGGAMAATIIHSLDERVPILEVHAHQGKRLRAEPVTLKYDQQKVHHLGVHADLEAQMTSWVPGETKKSPDRVDALVYAVTALLIKPPGRLGSGKMRARSLAGRRLPETRLRGQ